MTSETARIHRYKYTLAFEFKIHISALGTEIDGWYKYSLAFELVHFSALGHSTPLFLRVIAETQHATPKETYVRLNIRVAFELPNRTIFPPLSSVTLSHIHFLVHYSGKC